MPALTGSELLAGPRGRGLCVAVAERLGAGVRSARLDAAWNLTDLDRHRRFVDILRAVQHEGLREWHDPARFLGPMDETVSLAVYWQPPHDVDVSAARPDVAEALRPIADEIAAAPGAQWWNEPLDPMNLRCTVQFDDEPPQPSSFTGSADRFIGAAERLRTWRSRTTTAELDAAGLPDDPAAPHSGHWWSTPGPVGLPTTTRPYAGLGSVELAWQEDSLGQRNATVWTVHPTTEPRVYEIDGPAALARLVTRYPIEVTRSRRHDWYRATGRDGRWLIPDWAAASVDWDVVHVSVAGYLSTAGRVVPVTDEAATMLAGWNPDQAWWLTDLLAPGQSTSWRRDDDGSWHRDDDGSSRTT